MLDLLGKGLLSEAAAPIRCGSVADRRLASTRSGTVKDMPSLVHGDTVPQARCDRSAWRAVCQDRFEGPVR
jgi:hypothetical protein